VSFKFYKLINDDPAVDELFRDLMFDRYRGSVAAG
jgi:hypothetical protein